MATYNKYILACEHFGLTTQQVHGKSTQPMYQALSNALQAWRNCGESKNLEWEPRWKKTLEGLVYNYAPSGSGFDNGTKLDLDDSTPEKLVFDTAFHHMDDNGMYDGWTDHRVIVRPSLAYDIHISITGRDRRDIKEYIHEAFREFLTLTVDNGYEVVPEKDYMVEVEG